MKTPPLLSAFTPTDTTSVQVQAWAQDFEGFFETYSPFVARLGLRLIGREDELDDLVQDVFIAAFEGLSRLRDPAAVRGWLARITTRQATRRLRWRRARRWVGLDAVDYARQVDPQASPETRVRLIRLFQHLDNLPPDDRVAWTLRHLEGLSFQEIADHCQCALRTAKRRVHRTNRALREVLQHDG